MEIFRMQFAVWLLAFAPLCVRAGGDEVVVVFNPRMPESKAIADYYAKARGVPANHVYGFATTTNEEMSRAEFREALQLPLARKLESDGLWKYGRTAYPATNGQPAREFRRVVVSKIRYAVLCRGVPLKIASDPGLVEPVDTNLPAALQRNEAAVDSELAWLPAIEMNLPLTGPMANPFYGITNAAALNPTNGILLVARLDGPTAAIARGLVDKSLEAERDGMWGRGYFDARGLDRTNGYFLGDEWILGAAAVSRSIGFETIVDDKPALFPADFPMSQIAFYAGWYADSVCGPFQLPKVEFMPGAFAYHLHSSSAASIRDPNRFWVGPLLARGATCTMGCVSEPYLPLTPNVATFLVRFTASQFSFGEAAWAAQPALSWQTTVAGDPLYRPFAKLPQQLEMELMQRRSPLMEWDYLRHVNVDLLRGASLAESAGFLEHLPATTNSAVLTEKLAGLYELQGKHDMAINADEAALRLSTSHEQRIRLRLALADNLMASHFAAAARRDYQKLLEEAPDYPGKAAIEEKINSLGEQFSPTNAPAGR
jgi:uncharacterized protein (TIGR03790 family)